MDELVNMKVNGEEQSAESQNSETSSSSSPEPQDIPDWIFDYEQMSSVRVDSKNIVSPQDQTTLYEETQGTSTFGIYKTPKSRPSSAIENVVAEVESTPKKSRDIPMPLLNWADSEEVWLNIVYKEEATSNMRNFKIFDDRSTYLPRMRAILLDWIMEVCEVYHLRRNTYYLAVDYIDRYLTLKPSVPKTQLQLLGVSCLYIAAKLEEIYPPKVSEFSYVCDGACTEEEILACEILLLNTLEWEVNTMTPTGYLNLYMQIHNNADELKKLKSLPLHDVHFEYPQYSGYQFVRASHLIDIFSMDPGFLKFNYSVIAAAAMLYTYDKNVALKVSGLKWKQLKSCVSYMCVFNYIIEEALDPRLAAVIPSQDDERLSRSFTYIRKRVPKLTQSENHSFQTHLIDLDYFERSVILRVKQYGILVDKIYVRKYKTENDDSNDESNSEDAPTVMVYEITPPASQWKEPYGHSSPPPKPTDRDYETGKVNIFNITERRMVTFDDILSSIHHDSKSVKRVKPLVQSELGYN